MSLYNPEWMRSYLFYTFSCLYWWVDVILELEKCSFIPTDDIALSFRFSHMSYLTAELNVVYCFAQLSLQREQIYGKERRPYKKGHITLQSTPLPARGV